MTREGFDAIAAEIEHLWRVERPDVVDQVSEAADLGDRSENAAYIYGKKRLRQIDSRLRYLRHKIDGVVVIDPADQIQHKDVRFGALVEVVDDDDVSKVWRIVDKDETDPKRGRISTQSPVGQALMGKKVGDYIEVSLPKGLVGLEIVSIRYGADEP